MSDPVTLGDYKFAVGLTGTIDLDTGCITIDGMPERWWWLSFADGDLPEGSQFLGVALVRGQNIADAARAAHVLGCNPGGEVQGVECREGTMVPDEYANRLLTKGEALALDAMWKERGE